MAVMAIGLVGAYLAPAGYAALGYTIASSLATYALAETTNITNEGSKLSELKMTTSAEGSPIPVIAGTVRIAGNVIMLSELFTEKHVDRQSAGGKSGGGTEVTNITYTHSVHAALLLAEGEVDLLQIFQNGKLIHDLTTDNTGYISELKCKYRFYRGTADQMPDPTFETIYKEKTIPYRRYAYIVFENMPVDSSGNLPNLTFTVCSSDQKKSEIKETISDYTTDISSFNSNVLYNNNTASFYFLSLNRNICKASETGLEKSFLYGINDGAYNAIGHLENGDFWAEGRKTINDYYEEGYFVFDENLRQKRFIKKSSFKYDTSVNSRFNLPKKYQSGGGNFYGIYLNPSLGEKLYLCKNNKNFENIAVKDFVLSKIKTTSATGFYDERKTTLNYINLQNKTNFEYDNNNNCLYYLSYQQGNNYTDGRDNKRVLAISKIDLRSNLTLSTISEEFVTIINDDDKLNFSINDFIFDSETRCFYITVNYNSGQKLIIYNLDKLEIVKEIDLGLIISSGYNKELKTISYHKNTTVNNCFEYNYFDDIVKEYTLVNTYSNSDIYFNKNYGAQLQLRLNINNVIIYKNLGERFIKSGHSLDGFIKKICKKTGLKEEQFDTSSLTNDVIKGYYISNSTNVRSSLEQLAVVFDFDVVESDWIMKFKKSNSDSVKTINIKELNALKFSKDVSFTRNLTTSHKQELDLPQSVTIRYLSDDNDFQQAAQNALRYAVNTENIVSRDLAISLSSDEAKQLAEKIMYKSYAQRDNYTFETNFDYLNLEPTDIINIDTNNQIYTMKIVKVDTSNGIIKFNCVSEDSTVYKQYGEGAKNQNGNQTINATSITSTEFLDIPILRNTDDNSGFYIATYATDNNLKWKGSNVYAANESAGAYLNVNTIEVQSVVGRTLKKIGNFKGGFRTDYLNYVDVTIMNDELSSVSEDQFLSGYNTALINKEIIMFKNAELIAPRTYRLSQFLRGCFNTYDEINNHSDNDFFTILDSETISRIVTDGTDVNNERFYKNVSFGKFLNDSYEYTFINENKGMQCYKVETMYSNRNSNNDLILEWLPSVRGNGLLLDYQDVFDVDNDNYEIDILNNNSVIRTIRINNSRNAIYSNIEQVADFGTNQSLIDFNIYKLNKNGRRGNVKNYNL